MSKVRTFSRYFPKCHIRQGEQTFFVEKIWKWYYDAHNGDVSDLLWYNEQYDNLFAVDAIKNVQNLEPKGHTIRNGKHFKSGDFFSPRIWTGKPYASKQIAIAQDFELKKVFDIKIEIDEDLVTIIIDRKIFYEENSKFCTQYSALEYLAKNDGLTAEDFKSWFKWGKKPFDGQILCWSDDVEY
jgi:hypothetical protein